VTSLKLPRTIRLDPSDTFVFRRSAEPGEWAVTGTFLFDPAGVEALDTKGRTAFRSGFLGIGSFGWSTLAVVTDASAQERESVVAQLAARLVEHLGAPDLDSARAAAEEEVAFAASLCDHPAQTLLALHRTLEDGTIRERFRTLRPREDSPKDGFRAFEFLEVEGEEDAVETVDLLALGKKVGT
jgi:phenylpyruvate tautomerase PptA (4-oxalocrotonate tautomerase family)